MRLVDQWELIEGDLPDDWPAVHLSVRTESADDLPRAAAVLSPANPLRQRDALLLTVRRAGGPAGPEAVRRLFRRLDQRRIWSELELLGVEVGQEAPVHTEAPVRSLPATWDEAVAGLPTDWTDLLCYLELDSSDYRPRAALLCAPMNPTADRVQAGFYFRAARRSGYGVSASMTRRCLERCEAERITGSARVLRVLSDTDDVATQGPVFYIGGRVL
jgi:hypothetical protein